MTKVKYYSVTMDCTPEVGHTEQLSVLLRIVNFISSVQRWAALQKHVKHLTVKYLSTTRWEARGSATMSMANSIQNEPMTWRCVLCLVIWYNALYQIKHVSKIPQSPNVSLETQKKETKGVQTYLNNFRVSGLSAFQTDA